MHEARSLKAEAVIKSRHNGTWGVTTSAGWFAQLPAALFKYQSALGLKTGELTFLLHVESFRRKDSMPYPSVALVARNAGVTYRTALRWRASLVDRGYMKLVYRNISVARKNGGTYIRTITCYDITGLSEALEKLYAREGVSNVVSIEDIKARQAARLNKLNSTVAGASVKANAQKAKNVARDAKRRRSSDHVEKRSKPGKPLTPDEKRAVRRIEDCFIRACGEHFPAFKTKNFGGKEYGILRNYINEVDGDVVRVEATVEYGVSNWDSITKRMFKQDDPGYPRISTIVSLREHLDADVQRLANKTTESTGDRSTIEAEISAWREANPGKWLPQALRDRLEKANK